MVTTATSPQLPAALTAPAAQPGQQVNGKTTAAAISSDFETFLKMLTVQMENQDPLNPMDATDQAMQLATFSGVEQQVQTNQLLEGLGAQLGLMGLSDIAGWVGMEARVDAPAHFDGSPLTLVPSPPSTADKVELVVKNAEGTIVQQVGIPVSSDPIQWAGVGGDGTPLPSGNYSFEIISSSNGKFLSTDPVENYSKVTESRSEDGKLWLVLESGAKVDATSVKSLRDAG